MIDEEKQFTEETQNSTVNPSENSEQTESEAMSAEVDLHPDSEENVKFSPTEAAAEQVPPISMEEFLSIPDDSESESTADPDAAASVDRAELDALQQEIESLKIQLERRTSEHVRLAADFENFRKRTSREREELEDRIKCTTVTEMLPVVDNFERARSQIKPQTESEMTIHKSYQSVYKQLVDALKRLGVSPMRAEGQVFDPNLHEAVMRESTSEQPEGTVLEELMRGYVLGERILRHAMVKVAVAPDGDDGSQADSPDAMEA